MKTLARLTLPLLAFGTIAAQSPTPPAPDVPLSLNLPEGALVAPGPAPDLELLYTGDVIGYLEDCGCKVNPAGGLARRAWLVNQIKTNYPETPLVLLDAGNFSDNPTEKGDVRTAALLKEMVNLGYKAVAVGDRDLTMGYDDLMKRIEGLPMPFISTNIVKQGTSDPVFPPYTVVEAKGKDGKPIRIGVLAVIRYTPVWQKSGPKGTNLATAPVVDSVRRYYAEVRAKSDAVVLIASLAKDDVRELATQFPDLDMIIGNYGGIYSDKEERAGKVPIYYTGNQGKRIGESRIMLDASRHPSEIRSYVHFLTANYPSDRQMADRIAALAPPKPGTEEKDAQPHPAKLVLKPN
jgi:2',3'-cyclic-nucleotide 2'-phosphodiesterase (5'-nucleotidase family)